MAGNTIALGATAVIVVLAVVFLFTTAARRDRGAAVGTGADESRRRGERDEADGAGGGSSGREVERLAALERHGGGREVVLSAEGAPPAVRAPMDPDALAVTRRQFVNRSVVAFFGLGLAGFGSASIAFLWPSLSGGFGSKIKVDKLDDVLSDIQSKREPFYVAEARTWISAYPKEAAAKAAGAYTGGVLEGMKEGVVALYQKCVHLGCRVPWCKSSQWFECPCHGSKYNRVGEKKGGPAPRGLDRFAVEIRGGVLFVDTKEVIQGPPIGINTTGQEAEGPHCA